MPSTNRSYRKSWFELVWAVIVSASAKVLVQRPVNAIQADFYWELITQSLLAGNIPPYLAGSWKFSQRHPGSVEQLLLFPARKKKWKNVFKMVLASCFYVVFRILPITVVVCPCAWGSKTEWNQKYRNQGGVIINITLFREVHVRPRSEVFSRKLHRPDSCSSRIELEQNNVCRCHKLAHESIATG